MRFMKPVSRQIVIAYGIVLGMIAVLGVAPWTLVEAQDKVERKKDQIEQKAQVGPKEKTERGRFVSFKDGTLTIQANSGALLGNKLPENTKTLVWDHDKGVYKPGSTADALNKVKPGTWFVVNVAKENAIIRIGSRKGETIGTFVSFKDDRLLIIGKNLGESFVKKYGDNVHFKKFRSDVPIYESIDGGEYELVKGALRTILANLKEGTVVTVHGEGDDNITRIDIGVAKKK